MKDGVNPDVKAFVDVWKRPLRIRQDGPVRFYGVGIATMLAELDAEAVSMRPGQRWCQRPGTHAPDCECARL